MFPFLAQVAEPNAFADKLDSLARTPLSQVVIVVAFCTIIRLAVFPKLMKTPPHMRSGTYSGLRILNEFMDAIIYAGVFVFLLIRPFAVQTFRIPSGSMFDTLLLNDFIIANKAVFRYSDPQFGDIVVFKPPVYGKPMEDEDKDLDYIKRCRGVPGDVIEIRNGLFYRNGQEVREPFVKFGEGMDRMVYDFKLVQYKGEYWPLLWRPGSLPNLENRTVNKYWAMDDQTAHLLASLPPASIPPKHYLMMGDNREGSSDGRSWGLVERESIVGKSMVIWWPPSRWQVTR